MQALVIEKMNDYSIILTADGAFLTVPTQPGWEAGFEIVCALPAQQEEVPLALVKSEGSSDDGKRKNAIRQFRRLLMAAAACLVVLVGFQLYSGAQEPSAYVEVGINPVVRMAVNESGRIVRVEGVNQDGVDLLVKMGVDYDNITDETRRVLEQAVQEGYFNNTGNQVQFSISDSDTQSAAQLEQLLLRTAAQVLQENAVQTKVSAQKVPLSQAQTVRDSVDEQVSQGVPLKQAYENAGWKQSATELWLKQVEYRGNGRLELEFTRHIVSVDNGVVIRDSAGRAVPCTVERAEGDEWEIRADGLIDGEVYTIELQQLTDESGQTVSLQGSFLAREGAETEQGVESVYPRAELFPTGQLKVCFADDQTKERQITGRERVVITNAAGETLEAEAFRFVNGVWYIQTDAVQPGELVQVRIEPAPSGKKKATALTGMFAVWDAGPQGAIAETEYHGNGKFEIDFREKIDWIGKVTITATAEDGTVLSGALKNLEDDDVRAYFTGIQPGASYTFDLLDDYVGVPVSGRLIADEGREIGQ